METLEIIGLGLTGLSFLLWFANKVIGTTAPAHHSQDPKGMESNAQNQTNPYMGLRLQALELLPEHVGLHDRPSELQVYALIAEWQEDRTMITLFATIAGDASLYFSVGGALLGGVGHPAVNAAAKQWIAEAQHHLQFAQKSSELSPPRSGNIKFFLLTNRGRYVGQDSLDNSQRQQSAWFGLFANMQKLLTAMREANPS